MNGTRKKQANRETHLMLFAGFALAVWLRLTSSSTSPMASR
jgi:hypothetical protein